MKRFIIAISVMMLSVSAFAQKGVEDGSKYGHGEDSIRCIQNLSLYQTYAKQGDYATALEFWTIAYTDSDNKSFHNTSFLLIVLVKSTFHEPSFAKGHTDRQLVIILLDQRLFRRKRLTYFKSNIQHRTLSFQRKSCTKS